MIILLIICVLAQNVSSNFTNFDMQEALKLFKSMHSADHSSNLRGTLPRVPNSADLLNVLHEVKVVPEEWPHEDTNATPLIESRELKDAEGDGRLLNWLKLAKDEHAKSKNKEKDAFAKEKTAETTTATRPADVEGRRILKWFKTLIGRNTNPPSSTTEDNLSVIPKPVENSVLSQFNEVLNKLVHVLENLNLNLGRHLSAENQTHAVLLLKVPIKDTTTRRNQHFRYKRDVIGLNTNTTVDGSKKGNESNSNDIKAKIYVKTQSNDAKINTVQHKVQKDAKTNDEQVTSEAKVEESVEDNESDESTTLSSSVRRKNRRYYKRYNRRNNNELTELETESVKYKLLAHISENFKELKEKISPLDKIKQVYLDDNAYKVGYITANIDTLEVNLNKLKKEMEVNRKEWDETKVLDLFERINTSNHVVGNLMETLRQLMGNVPSPGVGLYQ